MKQIILKYLFAILFVFSPFFSSAYNSGDIGSYKTGCHCGPISWTGTVNSGWAQWNGAAWTFLGTAYVPKSTDTVYILSGYTVSLDNKGDSCYRLIVESGATLYSAQSGGNEYNLFVYGDSIRNDGTIGNPGTTDGIDFNIEGSKCTIYSPGGNGKFEAFRIRKSKATGLSQATTNLTISMNIKLTCNNNGPYTDIYNYAATSASAFNVNFAKGTVDSLWSYGATPVGNLSFNGTAGSNSAYGYGSDTVLGTLVIADTLYLTTQNATKSCNFVIDSGGVVVTTYVNAPASTAKGFNLFLIASSAASSGGFLDILDTTQTTSFSLTNNTFNLQAGSTVEYGGPGHQNIPANLNYSNLTLGGTGTKSASGNLTVNYNLFINNSLVTLVPNTAISVGGNWTDYGTFNNTGSTVTFNGLIPTIITAPTGETFANVVINKTTLPQYITLDEATGTQMIIANTLTLTSGIIMADTTGSGNNYVLFGSSSAVSGANNNSFVYGRVEKYGNTAFTYPVGKGSRYRSVSVGALSVMDTVAVEYFHLNPYYGIPTPYDTSQKVPPIDHVSGKEYWVIWSSTITAPATITLSWDSVYSGGVTNPAGLVVAEDSLDNSGAATTWFSLGNGGTTGNDLSGTIISSLSLTLPVYGNRAAYTLASIDPRSANPLPVSLLTFNATVAQRNVLVTWTTASEINNDYFTIEKTADGTNFVSAGEVKGAGTSVSKINYSFTDLAPYKGVSYYRLKQTDFDGKYSYSRLAAINITSKQISSLILFPNPASDHVFINVGGVTAATAGLREKTYTLRIFDVSGREAMPQQIINFSYGVLQSIDVSALTNGVYMLELNSETDVQRVSLVKE